MMQLFVLIRRRLALFGFVWTRHGSSTGPCLRIRQGAHLVRSARSLSTRHHPRGWRCGDDDDVAGQHVKILVREAPQVPESWTSSLSWFVNCVVLRDVNPWPWNTELLWMCIEFQHLWSQVLVIKGLAYLLIYLSFSIEKRKWLKLKVSKYVFTSNWRSWDRIAE